MKGTFTKKETGLSAFDLRKAIKSTGGKKEYFDKMKNSSSEMDYLEYKYSNLDSLSEPVFTEYKFALKEKTGRRSRYHLPGSSDDRKTKKQSVHSKIPHLSG